MNGKGQKEDGVRSPGATAGGRDETLGSWASVSSVLARMAWAVLHPSQSWAGSPGTLLLTAGLTASSCGKKDLGNNTSPGPPHTCVILEKKKLEGN